MVNKSSNGNTMTAVEIALAMERCVRANLPATYLSRLRGARWMKHFTLLPSMQQLGREQFVQELMDCPTPVFALPVPF